MKITRSLSFSRISFVSFASFAVRLGLVFAGAMAGAAAACDKPVYLTLDTGGMQSAELIADILKKHDVRATFFIANEKTYRGDRSLDESWAPYWKARAAEGHAFGSHTWRHWYFRQDADDGRVAYVARGGQQKELLDRDGVCRELKQPGAAFKAMTGRELDPLWRAPGGRTTPRTLEYAKACGFARHVGWADAGFLGDELPSDRYPNDALLQRALKNVRAGDVLMMHLGIWSRQEPFAPMLDPLIAGLKARGFCFRTLS
ncbi:MAG: polysaccharide deacetylase family protein [Pseudomonadota bacterium]